MWKRVFGTRDTRKNTQANEWKGFDQIDFDRLPQHIAIIMDGNGRWAKSRGLMRTFGHKTGVDTFKKIVKAAALKLHIHTMTAYAFSTENWKRPHQEIDFLMRLFSEYLEKEIDELYGDNIQIRFIGRVEELSDGLRKQIENAQTRTASNTGMVLNVAVNYGSKDEIVRAVKGLAAEVAAGDRNAEEITEEDLEAKLYTGGQPPVDLLIRPSGDLRISNFLLWQVAYAEFWFTEVNWPDFTPEHLIEAILAYQKRDRRFGGLSEKQ